MFFCWPSPLSTLTFRVIFRYHPLYGTLVDRGGAAAAGGAQPPKPSDLEVRDITDLVCK